MDLTLDQVEDADRIVERMNEQMNEEIRVRNLTILKKYRWTKLFNGILRQLFLFIFFQFYINFKKSVPGERNIKITFFCKFITS